MTGGIQPEAIFRALEPVEDKILDKRRREKEVEGGQGDNDKNNNNDDNVEGLHPLERKILERLQDPRLR